MRALSCIRGNKVFELKRVVLVEPSLFHVPNGFAYYIAQEIRQMSPDRNVKQSTCPSAKLRALLSTAVRQLRWARRKVRCLIQRR